MYILRRIGVFCVLAFGTVSLFAQVQPPEKLAFVAARTEAQPTGGAFFGMVRDLYVVDRMGAKPRRLGEGDSPTWSPDGERLAYCADPLPFSQTKIFENNAKSRQLTHFKGGACLPDWWPDQTKIAYTGYTWKHNAGEPSIYVVSADGTGGNSFLGAGYAPKWSPDGKMIAFCRNEPSGREWGIWIINADGSGNPRKK